MDRARPQNRPSNRASDPVAWPTVDHETMTWTGTPRATWGPAATRMSSLASDYRAAIPPRIAALTPRLDPETVTAGEQATRELTRFDAELGDRVRWFGPLLLRSEAASSSQIENLSASARQILTAELGAKAPRNATLIAANTRSMQAALDLASDVSAASIARMHEVLMAGQDRHTPGRWRTEPVWIGTSGESPVGATFVAPAAERIQYLIDDLIEFAARDDLAPLTQVAVAHAQFETIHPFTDGNGRTGRAFAQSLLRHLGVTRNVAVPVSAGLLAYTDEYVAALTAYRNGDPAAIVTRFALAGISAVANARQMLNEIDDIAAGWRTRITARSDSAVWPLLDLIPRRPVLDAVTAADELGVHRQNVYPALGRLTEVGILRSKDEYRAGPVWRSDEILHALDRFAERAGRRGG